MGVVGVVLLVWSALSSGGMTSGLGLIGAMLCLYAASMMGLRWFYRWRAGVRLGYSWVPRTLGELSGECVDRGGIAPVRTGGFDVSRWIEKTGADGARVISGSLNFPRVESPPDPGEVEEIRWGQVRGFSRVLILSFAVLIVAFNLRLGVPLTVSSFADYAFSWDIGRHARLASGSSTVHDVERAGRSGRLVDGRLWRAEGGLSSNRLDPLV